MLLIRWFQCLFVAVLPFRAVFRLWDSFIASSATAFDARPAAGVAKILTVAIALVRRVVAEFARLRRQHADELRQVRLFVRACSSIHA